MTRWKPRTAAWITILLLAGVSFLLLGGDHQRIANSQGNERRFTGWVEIGNGDCTANDIGQTIGVKVPEAAQCNANSVGTIAVCWDGNSFAHPLRSGQWCTYKSKAAYPCRGGANTGTVYECRGGVSKLPPEENTLPPVTAKPITWETAANQLEQGIQRFTLTCPAAGSINNRVWGTDLYTNDSSICSAAVHSGLITTAGGGTVTIERAGGASSYRGTTRNGVTTKDFGEWGGSFVFARSGSSKYPPDDHTIPPPAATQVTWATQANQLGGQAGQRFTLACPPAGEIAGRLWGTDLYTNDSSICTAAVHSGLITTAAGGTVMIELRAGASSYRGTARRGVTSKDFGAWNGSFVFARPGSSKYPQDEYTIPPPAATQVTWATQANQLGGQAGQRFTLVCPPAGELAGRLWGTDLYTNDSSICTAAVHSGLITTAAGGTVMIELRAGASSYSGTARHGVTSKDFGAWDGSFVFVR